MKIHGVPPSGWGYDNFYNIGCVFGRVISVNHSNFNHATALVITDCLFLINCKMVLDLMGHQHKICISEDYNYRHGEDHAGIPEPPPLTTPSSPTSHGDNQIDTPRVPTHAPSDPDHSETQENSTHEVVDSDNLEPPISNPPL